ncbi:putative NADPH-dependent FMN/FAD containing oxidoreductase [Thermoascus aurantiacus ATCC 26904]
MIADGDQQHAERSAIVLYGSETGNAQEVAEELGRMAERLHFVTHVSEMNAVKAESLSSYTLTFFVVSTTGQGDFPANARTFWKSLLLKRLPPDFLKGVNFVLFGLGDSSYPKFNFASRKLYKRLLQLGANEVYLSGEGDQRHPEGLEGTFFPWSETLRKRLLDKYPLPPGKEPIPDDVQLPPKWVLEEREKPEVPPEPEPVAQDAGDLDKDADKYPAYWRVDHDTRPLPNTFTATLTENKRLTPQKHWQDVRHMCLTVPEKIPYAPGDIISILPRNFAKDVDELLGMLGWEEHADKPIRFAPGETLRGRKDIPPPPIPYLVDYPHLTLRTLLTDYLDIRAIPPRSFFLALSHYATDDYQKERLLEFLDPQYIDELWDYTTRPRRSILEVLQEFNSVKIPWQHALSVFPILRSRQFSIASGGELKRTPDGKTRFELLVAIVRYQTVIKRIREGVCTRYLAVLRPGSTLKVQHLKGGLSPTLQQLTGPSVLIGPGTGVAPLRSMIWEKAALAKAYREKHPGTEPPIGPTILLFGNRNRNADFFYEDEWPRLAETIDLTVLTAFSRDQRQKIYVQDRIRENYPLFFRLLHDQNGSVFICGSSGRMPQALREALIESFQHPYKALGEEDRCSRQEAEKYLTEMEKVGRYKQETW